MKTVRKNIFQDVEMFELGFSYFGNPLMYVYFYFIDGVVIDTGQRHTRNSVLDLLDGRKISFVLLTHHHEDHSGNASIIKKRFQVDVYSHPLGIAKLEKGFNIMCYQRYVWGRGEPVICRPIPSKISTNRFNLIPIHTPGHSKDHTVFYVPDRGYLFSGDLYLGDKIKYFRSDQWICQEIDSLREVLRYDFDVLFCGHRPRLKNGKKHIRAKLDFLENLYGEISYYIDRGYSEKEVMQKTKLKEVLPVKIFTQGNVSAKNIVRSVIRCKQHKKVMDNKG